MTTTSKKEEVTAWSFVDFRVDLDSIRSIQLEETRVLEVCYGAEFILNESRMMNVIDIQAPPLVKP